MRPGLRTRETASAQEGAGWPHPGLFVRTPNIGGAEKPACFSYPQRPEAVYRVPEIPWLDPGPYRFECIAIWADGTIALQSQGAGTWQMIEGSD